MKTRRFPIQPTAPAEARAFARDLLRARSCTSDVELAVSELVTNVVRHDPAAHSLEVAVESRVDEVRLEITTIGSDDRTRPFAFDPRDGWPGPDNLNGRGLAIINSIATKWGIEANDRVSVWCVIPC